VAAESSDRLNNFSYPSRLQIFFLASLSSIANSNSATVFTDSSRFTMAAVYKTLSSSAPQEKEPGERKNKQRVLILVRAIHCTTHRLT